jgi:hypothetical protein
MGVKLVHTWDDLTSFCTRCGTSRLQYVETGAGCAVDASNVLAVSHVISRRRLGDLIGHEIDRLVSCVIPNLDAALRTAAANVDGDDGPWAA